MLNLCIALVIVDCIYLAQKPVTWMALGVMVWILTSLFYAQRA